VVVAPDHHDGTATSWMIREADGKLTPKLYLKPTDLMWVVHVQMLVSHIHIWFRWGNAEPDFKFAFRLDQLAFRRNEIYDAFSHLRNLINLGQPGSLYLISGAADSFNWARWKEAVNVNTKVTLAGHSFGGATMVGSRPRASSSSLTKYISSRCSLTLLLRVKTNSPFLELFSLTRG
jgi:platelet-activating factor acetylhydrolase